MVTVVSATGLAGEGGPRAGEGGGLGRFTTSQRRGWGWEVQPWQNLGKHVEKLRKVEETVGKLGKTREKLGKPMEISQKTGTYRKKAREIGKHVGKTRG